jgi:hypothetical protein
MIKFPENQVHDAIGLPIAFIEQDHGAVTPGVHPVGARVSG